MAARTRGFAPLIALIAVLAVTLAPLGAQARTAVSAVRLGIHPDGITRFVMDISEDLAFTVSSHLDPMRIVVNTGGVAWMTDAALPKPAGSVTRLRYEENRDGGRIVLALAEPAAVKSAFVIPPRDGQGWRFVMDLKQTTMAAFKADAREVPKAQAQSAPAQVQAPPSDATATTFAPVAAPAPERGPIVVMSPAVQPAASAPRAAKPKGGAIMSAVLPPPAPRPEPQTPTNAPTNAPAPAPLALPDLPEPVAVTKVAATLPAPEPMAKPKGDGRPVVVIDPGHGGVDPGAIGVSGAYEKNITLAAARELKRQLEATGRYKVFLTRERDVFIRLRDRISIARQFNADLFISLHADAVKNPSIRGLSVYTLSQTASDTEAEALAEKENKVDLIAGIDLSHESADVANILIDLAQRETMNRSAVFAGEIVDKLGRETTLLGNSHRFAGFAVLKAPDVPSVLVELGYLSHDDEERQLRQSRYREKLARALTRAVDGFFLQGQKARRP